MKQQRFSLADVEIGVPATLMATTKANQGNKYGVGNKNAVGHGAPKGNKNAVGHPGNTTLGRPHRLGIRKGEGKSRSTMWRRRQKAAMQE